LQAELIALQERAPMGALFYAVSLLGFGFIAVAVIVIAVACAALGQLA